MTLSEKFAMIKVLLLVFVVFGVCSCDVTEKREEKSLFFSKIWMFIEKWLINEEFWFISINERFFQKYWTQKKIENFHEVFLEF